MSTIVGNYVKTFAEADMGLLQGVSMNAPYAFKWVFLKRLHGHHIVCTGAGKEMRLPYRRRGGRDVAKVTINDPIFGPQKFKVAPFLRENGTPVGSAA